MRGKGSYEGKRRREWRGDRRGEYEKEVSGGGIKREVRRMRGRMMESERGGGE